MIKWEEEIEELLYENVQLIESTASLANIKGRSGALGRQVELRTPNAKVHDGRLDLLLKDRSGRPLIVELKRDWAKPRDIYQVLRYKALLPMLEESQRAELEAEFGKHIYNPRLMLAGREFTEEFEIVAAAAGVEILRLTGKSKTVDPAEIAEAVGAWRSFLDSGNPTLGDRPDWVQTLWKAFQEVVEEELGSEAEPEHSEIKGGLFDDQNSPFVDFAVDTTQRTDDEVWFVGFFEVRHGSDMLVFSPDHFYVGLIIGESASDKESYEQRRALVESYSGTDLFVEFKDGKDDYGTGYTTVPRSVLADVNEAKALFRRWIQISVKLEAQERLHSSD